MTPSERHEVLERQILRGRALGTIVEQAEDALLETLDDLWSEMSEEDRRAASERSVRRGGLIAPESLGLRDAVRNPGDQALPREAA
jgi:hypothetical protein